MELAFVDVETTGLDPQRHEMIEAAVVRVDPRTLEPIDHATVRIRPERLAEAEPRALEVNGYTDADWENALGLREALRQLAPLLEGTLVAGHNVGFDWGFLAHGFERVGLSQPRVDYHRLDTASLAWPLLASAEIDTLCLDAVCSALGLTRPSPHRALTDAFASLAVARRLRARFQRALMPRRRRVYVCHPYRETPEVNVAQLDALCWKIDEAGDVPIAPQLRLLAFLSDVTQRDRALALRRELIEACDEVRVYGDHVSEDMQLEIDHAEARGIPVCFVHDGGVA